MALVKMAPGEWLKPNSKTGEVRLVTLNKNLGKTKNTIGEWQRCYYCRYS